MSEQRSEIDLGEETASERRAAGGTIPFVLTEELLDLIDRPEEPSNIQLEFRLAGALDDRRFRSAVAAAVAVHPMTRASKAAGRVLLRRARWRIGGHRATETVRSLDCRSDAELSAARAAFYSQPIGLETAPALRLLLARRRGGTALMLSANHSIMDGIGALRFLHSIARAYRERPDPVPPIDPLAVRNLGDHFGEEVPSGASEAERVDVPTGVCSLVVDLPAGVRSLISPHRQADGDGYGFLRLVVPSGLVRSWAMHRHAPAATVNDRLIACLHLAIESWNAEHGQPSHVLASLMPVNLRPPGWRHEVVANLLTSGLVVSTPRQRSSARLLLPALVRQTRRIKSGIDLAEALNPPYWLRVLALSLVAVRGAGGASVAATLSNLGQFDALPDFGDEAGDVEEVWFSPPAPMPMGLGLGVVGWRGHLHMVLRYRRALFTDDAAGRFAGMFADTMSGLRREEAA